MNNWTIDSEKRQEIVRQIGHMNLLSISGGRVRALPDGIELPVDHGYKVRVHLTPADDYIVERVQVRGGKEYLHGARERVYCDEVAQAAYYASCFRSYDRDEWMRKS